MRKVRPGNRKSRKYFVRVLVWQWAWARIMAGLRMMTHLPVHYLHILGIIYVAR